MNAIIEESARENEVVEDVDVDVDAKADHVQEFEMSLEQKYAFMKFKDGANLFITGAGGTGKSRLIQSMIDHLTESKRSFKVCALTGCAAVLLGKEASTIHSWSGIGLGKLPKEKMAFSLMKKKKNLDRWRGVQTLIVDEVSMMSMKIFEMLDYVGKILRKDPRPFGGIQVIFTGDFYQLPPISNVEDPETGMFCFESVKWSKTFSPDNCIQLKRVFRQNDSTYIDILQNIRMGQITKEQIDCLSSRVNAKYDQTKYEGCIPTKLFPMRKQADNVNKMHYAALTETEIHYNMKIMTNCPILLESKRALTPEENRRCADLTREQMEFEVEKLITDVRSTRLLSLKIGTAVMCTINYDLERGICNGSQGVIIGFVEDPEKKGGENQIPMVRFVNGARIAMTMHGWQSDEYPCIAIYQVPLTMAWAMTIHKIQGATLNLAEMDIGRSVFEYGQTYVALSRVQNLDGLFLTSFHPHKIKANPKVIAFYAALLEITDEVMVNKISAAAAAEAKTTPASAKSEENKNGSDGCHGARFDAYKYRETDMDVISTNIKKIRL